MGTQNKEGAVHSTPEQCCRNRATSPNIKSQPREIELTEHNMMWSPWNRQSINLVVTKVALPGAEPLASKSDNWRYNNLVILN